MKANRKELITNLTELARVANTGGAYGTQNVHFSSVEEGGHRVVRMTTTDGGKLWLSCLMVSDGRPMSFAANARALLAIVGTYQSAEVELTGDTSWVRITDGETETSLIATEATMAEPKVETKFVGSWDSKEVTDALLYIVPAASKDDARPHLNCVKIEGSKIVVTDGHRLHAVELSAPSERDATVPLTMVSEVQRLLKHCDKLVVGTSEGEGEDTWNVLASCGRFTMTFVGKLPAPRFPPYEKVYPHEGPSFVFTCDPERLRAAVKKHVAVNGKNSGIMLAWGAQTQDLRVESVGSDNELSVRMRVDETNGTPVDFGVNATYLLDSLNGTKAPVAVEVRTATDALMVRLEKERHALVMPMRL